MYELAGQIEILSTFVEAPFSMAIPDTILLASFSLDTPKSVIYTPGIKWFMGKYMTHWVDIPGI